MKANEEMHVIRLDFHLNDAPLMFIGHLINDLLESVVDRSHKNVPPSLWTPDDMMHNQMKVVAIKLVFHVGTLA